jgi:hypothetical protein
LSQALNKFHSRHHRHLIIGNHEIEGVTLLNPSQSFCSVFSFLNPATLLLKSQLQGLSGQLMVIDKEDTFHDAVTLCSLRP